MAKRNVPLHVRLLGAPEFSWAGQPLAALRRSRVTAQLLAYLIVHSEQAHSRDKLATIFWPDLAAARARRNLNNALWELRRALPSRPRETDSLIVDSQTVRFNRQAPYWLDVEEFERGIRDFLYTANPGEANLQAAEAALELYHGDFLREFDSAWCETKRLALRESYLLALEKLIATYRAQNRTDKALHAAQRLVREDPFREAGHYQLVSLLIQLHRYPEARQSYERYAALWQQELSAEPSAQMQELVAELDLHFSPSGSLFNEESLEQLAQLLQQLVRLIPPTSARNPQPHAAALQVSAYAEQLGSRLRERQLLRPAASYLALAADSLMDLPPDRALQLREIELRRRCNQLYDLLADREQQAANLRRARELAALSGDESLQTEMLIHTAWMQMRQCQYQQAGATLAAAADLAQACGSHSWQAICWRLLGILGDETGDYRSAIRHHLATLELHVLERNEPAILIDRVNLSSALTAVGDFTEALAQLTSAAQQLTEATPALIRATQHGNLGNLWIKLGQYPCALPLIQEALKLTRQTGDREAESWAASRLALFYCETGADAQALQLAQHYYTLSRSLGLWRRVVELTDLLCAAWRAHGSNARALADAEALSDCAREHALQRYQIRGLYRLAQVNLRLHREQQAHRICEQMLALLRETGQELEEAPDLFWLAAQCAQGVRDGREYEQFKRQSLMELSRISQKIADPDLRASYLSRYRHLRQQAPAPS